MCEERGLFAHRPGVLEPEPLDPNRYVQLFVGLDVLDNRLRHELSRMPMFRLPSFDPTVVAIDHSVVVGRVCWLITRILEREGLWPMRWRNRFDTGEWISEKEEQKKFFDEKMPPALKWMVEGDFDVPVSAEWSAIFHVVSKATQFEVTCLAALWGRYNLEIDENTMDSVAEFTQPATVDGECPICGDDFGDADIKDHEPSVETICGHYIGRNCLQEWTNKFADEEGATETTCPNCCTALIIGMFPVRVQAKIANSLSI
jgi:hypothetical protein